MSISKLKKNRKSRLENLQNKLENEGKKSYKDDRFWNLTRDKETAIGKATIRFIPSSDEQYYISKYHHNFFNKDTGKWFIQTCPTSYHGDRAWDSCPVCQERSRLYNLGDDASKTLSNNIKRKTDYIANIYVVNDPGNPDNNGKVFLFKLGGRIKGKIDNLIKGEYGDDPVDPFDFWDGKDFIVKSKKGENDMVTYDDSTFTESNCFSDMSDKEIETIYELSYDLSTLVAKDQVPSYDDIEKNYNRVMGKTDKPTKSETLMEDEKTESAPEPEKKSSKEKSEPVIETSVEDDVDMDELNELLNSIE